MVHGANIILCGSADGVRNTKESISACITITDEERKGKKKNVRAAFFDLTLTQGQGLS